MSKQLMACNMTLICLQRPLGQPLRLLLRSELYSIHGITPERIVQKDILEANGLSDVIVVWDVDT